MSISFNGTQAPQLLVFGSFWRLVSPLRSLCNRVLSRLWARVLCNTTSLLFGIFLPGSAASTLLLLMMMTMIDAAYDDCRRTTCRCPKLMRKAHWVFFLVQRNDRSTSKISSLLLATAGNRIYISFLIHPCLAASDPHTIGALLPHQG